MKHLSLIFLLFFSVSVFAQQKGTITELSIRKDQPVNEFNQLIQVEFIIKADLEKFTYLLSKEESTFMEIKDDTGFDMLQAHKDYEVSMDSKGYSYNSNELVYSGPAKDGIKIRFNLAVAPKTGAKTINVKGQIGMINFGEKENTYELTNVPTQYQYGMPGFQSELGEIFIQEGGSYGYDDVDYTVYYIQSPRPVTSIKIADDREEFFARGQNLRDGEMVFKQIPETLDMEVTASETNVEVVPFELEVIVGF